LGGCKFLEICPFLQDFKFGRVQPLEVVSDDFLDFCGVCCHLPFCTADFTDLGFFSPYFIQAYQESVNLIYFFKEPAFCFIDFLWGFFGFFFIDFSPYFNYFFPSACLQICLFLFF
jgi:hypothetical protein